MMTFWIKIVTRITTEKVVESYMSEILETVEKD